MNNDPARYGKSQAVKGTCEELGILCIDLPLRDYSAEEEVFELRPMKNDIFILEFHDFDWSDEMTYPPEDEEILVKFVEGRHQQRAVVSFYKTGMFGPRFDFRHSANYVEQDNSMDIRILSWSRLP